MNMIQQNIDAPNYTAIKSKQNAAWSSGDYKKIGVTLQITGESLAEAADLAPGSNVLDVAAGNGNATLAFARRWCNVTSTDYVGMLLEGGRERARLKVLMWPLKWPMQKTCPLPAASSMPLCPASVSCSPPIRPKLLPRWFAFAGPVAKLPWPTGRPRALSARCSRRLENTFRRLLVSLLQQIGDARTGLLKTLADSSKEIETTVKAFHFRYASPQDFVDFFREFYGPVHKAFLALDTSGQKALNDGILETIAAFNRADDGSMSLYSDYAETVIIKA